MQWVVHIGKTAFQLAATLLGLSTLSIRHVFSSLSDLKAQSVRHLFCSCLMLAASSAVHTLTISICLATSWLKLSPAVQCGPPFLPWLPTAQALGILGQMQGHQ